MLEGSSPPTVADIPDDILALVHEREPVRWHPFAKRLFLSPAPFGSPSTRQHLVCLGGVPSLQESNDARHPAAFPGFELALTLLLLSLLT